MYKKKFLSFFSPRFMLFLLFIYATSMAVATFIEERYSTATAKNMVYESFWFEAIMSLLIICFLVSIKTYKLFSIKKIPVLLLHLSFILIFIGGFISRYIGFEGMMFIRKGNSENRIISDKTFIKLIISDNETENFYQSKYLMSNFHYNFEGKYLFKNQIFAVKVIDYIPYAKEVFYKKNSGKKIIRIVNSEQGHRVENFIESGNYKRIGNIIVSFNKYIKNGINIIENNSVLYINSSIDNIKYFDMNKNIGGNIDINKISHINPRRLYNFKGINIVIPDIVRKGELKYIPIDNDENKENALSAITAIISTKNNFKKVTFLGNKGQTKIDTSIILDNKKISIGYGSIYLYIPYSLYLKNFELKNYPGSDNPSSYSSNITVVEKNIKKDFHIYMNNAFHYKGYKFFQSGYDSDGNGTRLSVNHDDLGTYISYIGYLFLVIGMFSVLFYKETHFNIIRNKLNNLNKLKKLNNKKFFISILFIIIFPFIGKSNNVSYNKKNFSVENFSYIVKIPKNSSEEFGSILVQDFKGRIKPINTLSLELLRKIYKQNYIGSLNSDQWMISMIYDGWLISNYKTSIGWMKVPFIKIGKELVKKMIENYSINTDGYISLMDLYTIDKYTGNLRFIFDNEYQKAFDKHPSKRNNYDKDLINLNEKVNIILGIFQGRYLKIFPVKNSINKNWISYDFENQDKINKEIKSLVKDYFSSLYYGQNYYNWDYVNKVLKKIKKYQNIYGHKIIPSNNKIKLEIIYNKLNIFYNLMYIYLIIGSLLMILSFLKIFYNFNKFIKINKILLILLLIIFFIIHTIFLLLRWYISNHAPWSNGYESAIFISWCTILSGFIFFYNKNTFVLAISSIVSFIILAISNTSLMDPEITNLVPVLKSFWLMIHVSVITSSYAFLGIGAFIGLFVLLLLIVKGKNNKYNLNIYIEELTIINEMTLTIGLFLLTVGTFLGGIWANESWGRYWSWDPKETWALISIIVYTFVLHIRLIPKFNNFFYFNVFSLISISSIIMTYFGVNYYLSGLHSYAKGDPLPIPSWIYYIIVILTLIIWFSYYRAYKSK